MIAPKIPEREGAAKRPAKKPVRLRPRNDARRAKAHAEDFGPLADHVRRLPCCVWGCRQGPVDPAHVRAKRNAHAWVWIDGEQVGNIAPLCRGHHTGAPGGPRRPQHQIGVAAFERENTLAVCLPGASPLVLPTLAEVAAAVGRWVLAGAPGAEDGVPC